MRINLARKEENATYTGVFARYGTCFQYGIKFRTVLIVDIKSDGELVADHQWFMADQDFQDVMLSSGDVIEFNADVASYIKGYLGKNKKLKKEKAAKVDYQLVNIRNLRIIGNHRYDMYGSERLCPAQ